MKSRALFITGKNNNIYLPDYVVCQGCPYADKNRMPDVMPLDSTATDYSIDKGQHGDLCPPCAKQNLSSLGHWTINGEYSRHRLFKCRQWIWLIVPGLLEDKPGVISDV